MTPAEIFAYSQWAYEQAMKHKARHSYNRDIHARFLFWEDQFTAAREQYMKLLEEKEK